MLNVMIAIGFVLGFVGYLPLGNINLSVVQLSVSGEEKKWQLFILFAALMEFIYCFGCLYGMDQLLKQPQLISFLNWSAVAIFLFLGLYTFLHTFRAQNTSTTSSGLRRGVMVAIFNPLQIPFWLIWGVYVFQNGWVKSEGVSIAIFSFLCSLGTIAVLWLYAIAGRKLVAKLNVNRNILNRFIGSLLIVLAMYQTHKLLNI
jgi:threonine/homoserine/homoserine lactone efflux protein